MTDTKSIIGAWTKKAVARAAEPINLERFIEFAELTAKTALKLPRGVLQNDMEVFCPGGAVIPREFRNNPREWERRLLFDDGVTTPYHQNLVDVISEIRTFGCTRKYITEADAEQILTLGGKIEAYRERILNRSEDENADMGGEIAGAESDAAPHPVRRIAGRDRPKRAARPS